MFVFTGTDVVVFDHLKSQTLEKGKCFRFFFFVKELTLESRAVFFGKIRNKGVKVLEAVFFPVQRE